MKKITIIIIPIVVVVIGFLTMMFLTTFKESPERRTPPQMPKIVDVQVADLRNVKSEIIAYGRVSSAQPIIINSEVAGHLERGDIPFRPAFVVSTQMMSSND